MFGGSRDSDVRDSLRFVLRCVYAGLMTDDYLFFLNGTAPPETYTLSLHDALPIFRCCHLKNIWTAPLPPEPLFRGSAGMPRSEERFSRNAETDLVCRLLLEKKNCTSLARASALPKRRRSGRSRVAVGFDALKADK